jgi:hypothetical protein
LLSLHGTSGHRTAGDLLIHDQGVRRGPFGKRQGGIAGP